MTREKPKPEERANSGEKPRGEERAIVLEKTIMVRENHHIGASHDKRVTQARGASRKL